MMIAIYPFIWFANLDYTELYLRKRFLLGNALSKVGKILVRFPNPLLEVGWDYTAPIGGEFFFPPFQRGQLLTKMASRVLIGFLNITGSHMLKHDVCSLTCLAACTPFLSSTRMQLLLEAVVRVGFLIFSFHISHRQQFCIFSSKKRYIRQYLRCNRGWICDRLDFIFPRLILMM